MKNILKHVAVAVSLLAGFRLLMEELLRAGLIETTDWIVPLSRIALIPLPISNVEVLVISLSVLGMLFVLGRIKRDSRKRIPRSPAPPQEIVHEEQQTLPPPLVTDSHTITKEQVEKEWHSLEEADKETIREMVVQEGLWESDIIALLQTRGFLSHNARYDSLAERVSFVQCDFAGYHSILPNYHAHIETILAEDYADEVLA